MTFVQKQCIGATFASTSIYWKKKKIFTDSETNTGMIKIILNNFEKYG